MKAKKKSSKFNIKGADDPKNIKYDKQGNALKRGVMGKHIIDNIVQKERKITAIG